MNTELVDKELINAASDYRDDYIETKGVAGNGEAVIAFMRGANWQKQRSTNEAIDFMLYRDQHCLQSGEWWMTAYAGDGGKLYTIPQLCAHWKQINSKTQ